MKDLTVDLDRDEMAKVAPDLVRQMDEEPGPPLEIRYCLAWAVAPGGETVPGPGETDADAVRMWAERALTFQARAFAPGRGPRLRRPMGSFPIPDSVIDSIVVLAKDERDVDPSPDGLWTRVAARINAGPPFPEPEPEHAFAPRPSP